jgi:hypothetical protein
MRKIRVCVTGGRDYTNKDVVYRALDNSRASAFDIGTDIILVVGCATGADWLASEWAKERGVEFQIYEADWKKYRNAAGPIRNKQMLDSGIDKLCAFPGGRGTKNMTNICRKAGIYIREYTDADCSFR